METFSTPYGPFSCYKNDQNFYYHLINGSFWELDMIYNLLRPYWKDARVILDIGAHIGSHSFLYSFLNRNSVIHTFEPQTEIFKLLVQNLESRGNVINHNVCVGHLNTTVNLAKHSHLGDNESEPLSYGDGPNMNLGGVSLGTDGQSAKMITVDSLNLDICDYMKIDVEGAEPLVILGAEQTIRRCKPIICFEYDTKIDTSNMLTMFGFNNLPNVIELLETYGYIIKQIEGANWIALPKPL